MVSIAESANFHSKSLLTPHLVGNPRVADMTHPGVNYPLAAEMVWSAIHATALQQNGLELENEGKQGRVSTGVGPAQAVPLLWPNLTDREIHRYQQTITRYLNKYNNARCIKPGRGALRNVHATPGEHWVADEFTRIPPQPRGSRRADERPTTADEKQGNRREVSRRSYRHTKGDHSLCSPFGRCDAARNRDYQHQRGNHHHCDPVNCDSAIPDIPDASDARAHGDKGNAVTTPVDPNGSTTVDIQAGQGTIPPVSMTSQPRHAPSTPQPSEIDGMHQLFRAAEQVQTELDSLRHENAQLKATLDQFRTAVAGLGMG